MASLKKNYPGTITALFCLSISDKDKKLLKQRVTQLYIEECDLERQIQEYDLVSFITWFQVESG